MRVEASAPGRLCLFGEHQDYLGLPVIAMTINLFMKVEAERIEDETHLILHFEDLKKEEQLELNNGRLPYRSGVDHVHSAINVLRDEGFPLIPARLRFKSGIPVNSGSSSSSATLISMMSALATLANAPQSPKRLAELAYRAEVVEFNAPGGKMDHLSIAYGGLRLIEFEPKERCREFSVEPGAFILADSQQRKNTNKVLSRIRSPLERVRTELERSGRSLHELTLEEAVVLARGDTITQQYLLGAVENRNLTREAVKVLRAKTFHPEEFGRLLNEHQKVLRERLQVSTEKLDSLIDAALKAGALGGKINGSGGGGAMFVYAPENTERVARAIENAGGIAFIVRKASGVTVRRFDDVGLKEARKF
ncbi:MAG: galactokinase family protein [bacterium]